MIMGEDMEEKREVLLETENLMYSYDGEGDVLRGVNLQIGKGERIALLGPNGAGKSTLFLNLNGVYHAHGGKIRYRGQEINRKNRNMLRHHVGFVFQEPDSQIVASTVKAEVAFGPVNLRLPTEEVEERVSGSMKQMDLVRYQDRPPHYLSGGEKKRVSIAGVLAMEPEVVLFDEPAASLDPKNVDMLEELLERLWKQGKTLLISTHDVDFAYRWADRILVMVQGKLIADDIPGVLFEREDILQKAHLKKPVLLQVYNILSKAHTTFDRQKPPRSLQEFREMMDCLDL